ncbi:MAG: hypothetical protein WBM07_16300 [Chitinivibrionales bacterium]
MNKFISSVFSISIAMCFCGSSVFANDQIVPADSSKNQSASIPALPDSSHQDSTKAKPPADTLAGLSVHDSANKTDTTGQAQYQSTLPVMRRDIPRGVNEAGNSSKPQEREKFVASKDTVKPQVKSPILVVSINKTPGKSSSKFQLNKRSVMIALGVCALLGGGIALYLIKSAPGNGTAASNTGIPAPPSPPAAFAPSP